MDSHRLQKYGRLKEAGISAYVNYFKDNTDIGAVVKQNADLSHDALLEDKPVYTVAGRIMGVRTFGKTSFMTLKDRTGTIQVYIKKGTIPDDEFELFELIEAGDFIAAKGHLFKTKTGELTINAEHIMLLTKTMRDLPEKWHGLKDMEKRLRQRYLDLIANDDVKETFRKRSLIIQYLREYFISKDFIEVETPMMQAIAGGATAKPFITHHNALDMKLYLRIAPELYLKRLVVGGFERVFEINRNFRNEGVSVRHNPEFTMIEWYMAYADYHDLMDMIEEYFIQISTKINGKAVAYTESDDGTLTEIDLSGPWPRLTMEESLTRYADISADKLTTEESIRKLMAEHGVHADKSWGRGRMIMELFEELVESKLISPTFIIDYPKEVSPLAKSKKDDPDVTERFEMFLGGIELVNGFNELNDPFDQKERFEKQVKAREAGDDEAHMMDNDYITALEYGMPPTAGAGMGIDRFVMMLCGKRNIREVILFPHMRNDQPE